jgi:hypothetical protein
MLARAIPLVVVGSFPEQCSKQRATLYTVGQCVSTSMTWSSSDDNSPPLFSPLHLKRYAGLVKLQSSPQSFNCIKKKFNFIPWNLIFYVFLSNLILILLILIYFSFNLFLIGFYFLI